MLTIIKKMFRGKFEEAVEAVKRDPEVSEPVYMMIKGMKARPQDWRFRLVDKPGERDRMTTSRYENYGYKIVEAEITDRRVGYTYRIQLDVDRTGWLWTGSLMTTSKNPLVVRRVARYPAWMTHHEMIALSHVLEPLLQNRLDKVIEYKAREYRRSQEAAQRLFEQNQRLERERVIQIYLEA